MISAAHLSCNATSFLPPSGSTESTAYPATNDGQPAKSHVMVLAHVRRSGIYAQGLAPAEVEPLPAVEAASALLLLLTNQQMHCTTRRILLPSHLRASNPPPTPHRPRPQLRQRGHCVFVAARLPKWGWLRNWGKIDKRRAGSDQIWPVRTDIGRSRPNMGWAFTG